MLFLARCCITRWKRGIDAHEMKRLVAEDDEGQFLELKSAEERPNSLAAFANAEGGTLIYGSLRLRSAACSQRPVRTSVRPLWASSSVSFAPAAAWALTCS